MKRVLITGTTSGLGNALVREYNRRGWQTIAVNRRNYPESLAHLNYTCDVRDRRGIARMVEQEKETPIDLWLLNAGINKVDFDGVRLDTAVYNDVLDTNFTGVQHVVNEALVRLRQVPMTFVCLSSVTNFLPHPQCVGYTASKRMVAEHFAMLDHIPASIHSGLRFKTLILGPLATNICAPSTGTPWQRWIRDRLVASPERAARRIATFLEGNRQTLYYPLPVCALFWLAGKINRIIPFYR